MYKDLQVLQLNVLSLFNKIYLKHNVYGVLTDIQVKHANLNDYSWCSVLALRFGWEEVGRTRSAHGAPTAWRMVWITLVQSWNPKAQLKCE